MKRFRRYIFPTNIYLSLPSRDGKTLTIPDIAYEMASELCIGMQFDDWNHAYSVLLVYGHQIGFQPLNFDLKHYVQSFQMHHHIRTLYPIKHRWAKCFTFQDFNAGMSSSQQS
ncbi:13762_t:CDS:2 [Funneliformis caledonium]|uniref:13762_t:CDS:1 n=1 Tax=Funneliformis caledonium TaxID=1117310 RepID=A0A9N8V6D3_9GLOM|nr:13762_t:CDS:2 [Funneliformis caledonium]